MKKYKHATERDFKTVRTLLDMGISQAKVARIIDRTSTFVSRMARHKTWKSYEAYKAAWAAEQRAQRDAKLTKASASAPRASAPTLVKLVDKVIEDLYRLRDDLERT